MGYLTPAETLVTPASIPDFRSRRQPTRFTGCDQVDQIFLKANGKITCSCQRYFHVLADAREIDVGQWFNGEMQRYIRESFLAGEEPFDFCASCLSRLSSRASIQPIERTIRLHIKPSSYCNLYCELCACTFERRSDNPPPRSNLDFDLFATKLSEIVRADLSVAEVAFVGYGEPLFNSRVHDMASLSRRLFPQSRIFMDTNANFGDRRAEEIADCGLDEIRLGIDGCDQPTYAAYRESGNFAKAYAFAGKLASAIRAKSSTTRAVWKYILFRHNDSDEQIAQAVRMADQIGIPIIFDLTHGELASKRPIEQIRTAIGDHKLGSNIDLEASVPDDSPQGPSARIAEERSQVPTAEFSMHLASIARYSRRAASQLGALFGRLGRG